MAPPTVTEVFRRRAKFSFVSSCEWVRRLFSALGQVADVGVEIECGPRRAAAHEKGRGRPLKWRWREGRTRTRQPYLRANIGQHYARYTPRNTRTPFPCTAVCIYRQAERNSEGGYIMRRVHCAVNFETTFGKRVSCARHGNQRPVTWTMWPRSLDRKSTQCYFLEVTSNHCHV